MKIPMMFVYLDNVILNTYFLHPKTGTVFVKLRINEDYIFFLNSFFESFNRFLQI